MKALRALLQEAKLSEAITYVASQLKDNPENIELRSSFIELLCIDGQFERADKQLQLLIKQHPDCLVGAVNIRQLLRAAQARLDFEQGAATASLVREVDEAFTAMVQLRMALREKKASEVLTCAEQLEAQRQPVVMTIDGHTHSELRDLDDSLAGFLELFGTDGNYYLVPFDAIQRLEILPVRSLIEQVWRKVDIEIEGGLSGEAFVPMTYIGSQTDAEKLGRETDWCAVLGTEVCVGVGQKMMLFGEEALVLSQIGCAVEAKQPDQQSLANESDASSTVA
ncbi:type VI secretion system accessory protein TagJ [Photobacterium aphoticum]|uniref:type VI secretion system accessory protein TagJ n=1 Tax=Photobacterium aphoticum TaxID=754436 RepID=UPI0009E63BEE|nr:type VI secretion system accessory protein TagJ [Photobacterium aphoticum]PSU57763.1 protein of avirulence locus ImpE [Photobacterium aphoticum]GHA54988.1 protein of avirulence locus [Photobacterium aphoticum]